MALGHPWPQRVVPGCHKATRCTLVCPRARILLALCATRPIRSWPCGTQGQHPLCGRVAQAERACALGVPGCLGRPLLLGLADLDAGVGAVEAAGVAYVGDL